MTKNNLISVIYVNYNITTLIEESIHSLKKQPYKNFQIGIVDNSPGTKEYNKLRQIQDKNRDLRIELFKPKYNLGFAGGNNYALRRMKSDYYFLFNGDTEFEETSSLGSFVEFMQKNPNVGMIAPKILYYSQKNLIWYAGAEVDPTSHFFVRHIGEREIDRGQYNKIVNTAYAVGTALFVRKEVIEKCGYLDEILFLYAEETEWNFRVRSHGFMTLYFPDVTVYHKVKKSTKETRWIEQGSYFQSYLFLRNITNLAVQYYPWYIILYYLSHYAIKKLLTQLLVSIKNLDLKLFLIQLRALYIGILIGFYRKLGKSCSKIMIREYYFIDGFRKESRSIMNS